MARQVEGGVSRSKLLTEDDANNRGTAATLSGSETSTDIATEPGERKRQHLNLPDIIDISRLQVIQDRFAETHKVSSIIFDPTGKPITRFSNFSEFCSIVRNNDKGKQGCELWVSLVVETCVPREAKVHRCCNVPEIIKGAVPIFVDDRPVAAWAIGQAISREIDEGCIRRFARTIETDEETLLAASRKLTRMALSRFNRILLLLQSVAEHISTDAVSKLFQVRLMEERNEANRVLEEARQDFEKAVLKRTQELRYSNAKLKREVEERRRMETRLEHLNRLLRSIRTVNKLIIGATNPRNLIARICESIVDEKSYSAAWIVLNGEHSAVAAAVDRELGMGYSLIKRRIERGYHPPCTAMALSREGFVTIPDRSVCRDCQFLRWCHCDRMMTMRLRHGGVTLGVMAAVLPERVMDDREERSLFSEIADDVSFALHDIELEEKNRRSERDLHLSQERFKAVAVAIQDPIIMMDEDGRVVFWNNAATRLFGYEVEEVLGRDLHSLLAPPRYFKKYTSGMRRYRRRGEGKFLVKATELEALRKDGVSIPVELSLSVLRQDNRWQAIGIVRDMRERRRTELELRESERRFRETVNLLPQIVFEIDLDGDITFANRMAEESFGYRQENFGDNVNALQFIAPENRDHIVTRMSELIRGLRTSGVSECTIVRRDGSNCPCIIYASCITRDGVISGLRGIIADVSKIKQAQAQLAESENKFRTLTESAPVGIMIYQDESWIYANPAVQAITGYSDEEIRLKGLWNLVERTNGDRLGTFIRSEKQTESPSSEEETVIVTKSADRRWVSIRTEDVTIGQSPASIMLIVDITEKKRSEVELKRSEEKFRGIAERSFDGIFALDSAGFLAYASPAMERILRCSAGELTGRKLDDFISSEDRRKMEDALQKVMTGRYIEGLEVRIGCQTGAFSTVEINASAVVSDGAVMGVQGVVRDITYRKEAERDREELQKRLYQSQKMEAVGTLAGGIAHDFNNLLMGIQGNASLALLEMNRDNPVCERVRNIEDHVNRGAKLARQLLGFARGGKYEVKTTDVNELVKKSVEMFARTSKQLVICQSYDENLLAADVDKAQIEQVLLNIFINARQAMPAGGTLSIVTTNVELDEKQTAIFDSKPGDFVSIAIGDTGVGMDEITKEKIFEPFFTTKTIGSGTGLGLASAYGIVKNHNGIINVESMKGLGSTFTIYLPASHKTVKGEKALKRRLIHGTETILIIDDEETVLDVGRDLLTMLGYRVLKACSGPEAMQICRERAGDIHVVILDMIMPHMSGAEVFLELRKIDPSLKILLCSGYSMSDDVMKIVDKEAVLFLQKPFTIDQLSEKVRQVLDTSERGNGL
ncbi:MAG: PAS domain S-box protein [Deltaproteobacteria bacterium]|nr:PAS domain S-box protein [Deltaproteobacteria bacterium]